MKNNSLKKIITESGLSRIWRHVVKHESGTISAFRSARECGQGEVMTRKQNEHNNTLLKSKLLSMGYGVTKIKGVYIENYKTKYATKVKEDAYIVIDLKDMGKLKKDLIKLGTYFEQDSITFSKPNGTYYLISTNKCPYGHPGQGVIGKSEKLGRAFFGKDGEFYSMIRGRPFVFEDIDNRFQKMSNFSISEIRSIKYLAESIILK